MSFTPSIPASGQTLGNSRLQVVNNFSSLRTTISNATKPNHIDVNNVGAGKHIFVQIPTQSPSAANLPLNGEGGLITQNIGGSSELFYSRDNVNTHYQMTGSRSLGSSGYSVIFGALRIQWIQVSAADGATINFPVAFSAPPYCIVGNEIDGAGVFDFVKPLTGSATTTNFVLSLLRGDGNAQATPRNLNFIALGPV